MAGEQQESLIGWLASLITGLSIKMRTDKCTAPHFIDLPPKKRGRQVPVVIQRGMLRVQFDTETGRIILAAVGVECVECNGAVIDARTRTHFAVLPSIRVCQKKRSRPRICRPRRSHQDWPLQCDPGNRRNSRDHI